MGVIIDARDSMITDLKKLEPGSEEEYRHVQSIKMMSDIDREDRRLEFDIDKEETRKIEKSNEFLFDAQIKKYETMIKILEFTQHPIRSGTELLKTHMNNKTRIKRDVMGYTFEETGVIGSHTLNGAQKDRYD